ncbi:MAG: hypothetical protein K8W52_27835 [Deltaproteobacteria bacterium]|nr:hypothetical protein [Deltaproteobacteria bacterium]
MSERPPRVHRYRGAIELAVVAGVVLALSLYALWRMDYLSADTAHHVRMTDSTRTAYVAKNIAEGRGYTTNELPAFLLEFYDHAGKLHEDQWVNADRFPFTAYAIAALYTVTGSTSYEVGILGYNLICFIGFLVMLYWLSRTVWNDRWSATFTLTIALLHPLTYVYLYLKDGDMMLLTTGVLAGLWRYFERPPDELSWKRALGLGTLMGWLYLARPNIGSPFILYFGVIILRRLWTTWRARGLGAAIKSVARREGIVVAAIAAWCLPFVIHSLSEWGQPFFSANAIYQQPLGTRFSMGTDTWWKYSDPNQAMTLRTLIDGAPDQLMTKFTSSWIMTLKTTAGTWGMEIFLACGLLAYLARRPAADPTPADDADLERGRRVRRLAGIVGFAVLMNFLVLPLYGSHHYGYRHYLSFFLPLVWLCSGRAVALIIELLKPTWASARADIRRRPGLWVAIVLVPLLVWNLTSPAQDANQMFVSVARFTTTHWLTSLIALALLIWHSVLFRGAVYPRVVLGLSILVVARYVPNLELKRLNLSWFPADTRVWDTLRERKGLVMSFAMQGEVNWASDRRNIPAPENVLHAYSFLFDHGLEVEDVYVESAELMLDSWDGVFYYAAPGFESYARMQHYHGRLPGYQEVFYAASQKAYPKFKVKPRPKASTIWRLVDRDAVRAMGKSPDRIDIGDVANVVYTTHGWGDYFTIEGKSVVAATDATNRRYAAISEQPGEDSSVSFFLDDRRPTSVDVEVYATHATKLDFYWNLDLYAYDRVGDRPSHAVGSYTVAAPGWQTIHLTIPAGVTRKGYNKLGFHTAAFQPLVACTAAYTDDACGAVKVPMTDTMPDFNTAVRVVRVDGSGPPTPMRASLFARSLRFNY